MGEQTCTSRGCTDQPAKGCRKMCHAHYRRKVRMGVHGYRDATKAREHIRALRNLSWTYKQVEEAAGIAARQAWSIEHGEYRRIRRDTEERILALALVSRSSHRGVEATGTIRRLQALQWLGWPVKELANRIGYKPGTIHTVKYRGGVSAAFAQRVAVVFDELSATKGPCGQAAERARRDGHAPPAAWDDHTIDDPKAKPQGVLKTSRR